MVNLAFKIKQKPMKKVNGKYYKLVKTAMNGCIGCALGNECSLQSMICSSENEILIELSEEESKDIEIDEISNQIEVLKGILFDKEQKLKNLIG